MDNQKQIMVMDGIPEPMTPLTREIVHPDNIAFEIRLKRARVLSQTDIAGLKIQRKLLQMRGITTGEYLALRQEVKTAKGKLEAIRNDIGIILDEVITRTEIGEINNNVSIEKQAALAVKAGLIAPSVLVPFAEQFRAERRTLQRASLALRGMGTEAQTLIKIEKTIEAYETAQRQDALETLTKETLVKEARVYSQFILQEWAAREDCHHTIFNNAGKAKKILPRFDTVDITATRIYFKILTSTKGFFGFRRALPGSVSITSLIAEDVLVNIQAAAHRQTTCVIKPNGVWIVIDRLGSVGGLPDYIEYNRIMEFYPEFMREKVPVCLGVTENAQIVFLCLDDYPHFLIAGYTGAGKSNIVNVIISTLISKHSPKELGLLLIDMKGGLEFSHWEGLPHLMGNIAENITETAELLQRLETEMHRRFEMLRAKRAKKIDIYNARVTEDNRLPRIVLVFDEMATLAGQGEGTKRIVNSLRELTAKGRAVGIHIFCCTQHPSVEIITGAIKTNLTVRLTGRMPTPSASMTILGSGAAAHIDDVKGRMLLQISPDPKPIQTPFIDDRDIVKAMEKAAAFNLDKVQALPEATRIDAVYTPLKVAEIAVEHLNGNITYTAVYKALSDDLSQAQARELCAEIWKMKEIEVHGVLYRVETGRSNSRKLVAVEFENLKN